MSFTRFYLTAAGQEYLAKAQTGGTLNFTKAQIGSGYLPVGATITDRMALITPLQDVEISECIASGPAVTVKAQFTNRTPTGDILSPFWWAEAGLFAEIVGDADFPPALFAYANALDQAHADYIPETLTEFVFVWVCNISNATSVTATIDAGVIFLTATDDVKSNIVTFAEAEVRAAPVNGDTQATLWGKVKKLFTDLGSAAFTSTTDYATKTNPIFGVKFSLASSNPAGTRTDAAAGLAFAPGISAAGSSGFDGYSLYDLKTCNRAAGVVTAYLGEPGFSAVTKDTFVEIPKGYYRRWTDATYEYYLISKEVFPGAKLHPCFERGGEIKEFVYLAAYKSSYDGASKHESKSGALPDVVVSRTTSRTRSRARGVYASIQDLQIRDWLNLLFMVEAGTRDCQTAIGKGCSEMPYDATHVAVVAESAVNRIIVANAFADAFVIGQEISIGTTLGLNGIVADRAITAINVYDANNKAITFSGTAANIAIGNIVWTSRQKNGKTDAIGQGSGRATGTDGKTAVRYRGIENPWGNVWEWVDNLNIRNNLGYSDPEGRIDLYSDTDFGTNYIPFAAAFPAANGYMKRPMFDENIGVGCLPSDSSGSSSAQYFCDYYYQAAGDLAAVVGGSWNDGTNCGLWRWGLNNSAANTNITFGARLLEVP